MSDIHHSALGRRALGLFGRRIRFMPRYPPLLAVHLPLLREIALVLLALWFWARAGVAVRRNSGRSLPAQLVDLLWLGLRERIDPISYYLYGLYLPEHRADTAEYLTRYHTKNGVLQALNHLRRAPYPQRTELTDKLRFAGWCKRLGVRSPRVLMATDSDLAIEAIDPASLDTDLFVKLRYGKGAKNTRLYRRVAPLRYRAPDGSTLSLEQVRETLRVPGRKRALIVQQRLLNHPALADLAGESLLVVRVMSCLDPLGQPRITDAMLRVLAKLEPGWQRRKDDEWVAAVDVATGELGRLTGDMPETCTVWHDTHPVTGAALRCAAGCCRTGRPCARWRWRRTAASATASSLAGTSPSHPTDRRSWRAIRTRTCCSSSACTARRLAGARWGRCCMVTSIAWMLPFRPATNRGRCRPAACRRRLWLAC